MTKKEIANNISKRVGLQQQPVKRVIEEFLIELREALARGERVELRNFGVFKTKIVKAKTGRNPQTGESIFLPAKRKATFKAGKLLKNLLQSP